MKFESQKGEKVQESVLLVTNSGEFANKYIEIKPLIFFADEESSPNPNKNYLFKLMERKQC